LPLVKVIDNNSKTVVDKPVIAIFDRGDVAKLGWKVALEGGKLVVEPEAVFGQWPQLRMAAQQLSTLQAGALRLNFENQAKTVIRSLDGVKEKFEKRFNSKVTEAYVSVARPKDDAKPEDLKYFDAVFEKRTCLALGVFVKTADGEEAELPIIRYSFK